MKIVSTSQLSKYAKIAIYGNAGTGKTTLAATCDTPLIVSAESGLISLAEFDLPAVEINTIKDLNELIKFLKKGEHEYKTLYVDSLSEIAEKIHEHAIEEKQREAASLGKGYDPRQAYGELAIKMMSLTKTFRALAMNVVFTAKMDRFEDEGVQKYGPMFPGQAYGKNFPYLPDMVWAIEVTKKSGRVLRLQPNFQYYCKTRGGHHLPETISIPDITAETFNGFIQRIIDKVLSK
jgi:hypothetical protein